MSDDSIIGTPKHVLAWSEFRLGKLQIFLGSMLMKSKYAERTCVGLWGLVFTLKSMKKQMRMTLSGCKKIP